MTKTNVANFGNHISDYINQVIIDNDIICVNAKNGNAIILSEEVYNGIIETLYLSENPQVKADILHGINEPLRECISEVNIEW